MPVYCSLCRSPCQLRPGANYISCANCRSFTHIADLLPIRPLYNYMPPSPYNHGPPRSSPSPFGSKRAVIYGVTYEQTRHKLEGCSEDANRMKKLLIRWFNFPEHSIRMLTELDHNPGNYPIRKNIIRELRCLVAGCRSGDSLVSYFEGHGSQLRDYTGDELDGYHEILCPSDFFYKKTDLPSDYYKSQKKEIVQDKMIVDDEINDLIVGPLPHGANLHAIIDSCNSGTILDLAFLCRMYKKGNYYWKDHRPPSGRPKGTSGAKAICFSGCDDNQTSGETRTSGGLMTSSFIEVIKDGCELRYRDLLNDIRCGVRRKEASARGYRPFRHLNLRSEDGRGSGQEPQLTSSREFDVYSKRFSL